MEPNFHKNIASSVKL